MRQFLPHIIIPAIMPVNFFIIAFMPVEVLGCRTRGLFALLIAFVSGLGGLATALIAVKGRMRGDPNSIWWIGSSLVLVSPVIALLLMI